MKVQKICAGSYEVCLSTDVYDYIVEVEKVDPTFWKGVVLKYNKINDTYSSPEALFMASTKKEIIEDIRNTLI